MRNNSWLLIINNSRDQLPELIQENHSLSDLHQNMLETIYTKALRDAASETVLPLSIQVSFQQNALIQLAKH